MGMGKFGGYIRVSAVGQRDRETFLSPGLQRDRIKAWCNAHDHELVDIREDLDVSGGAADRTNLIDLVELVEAGRLDGVIVAKLDRFARSIVHGVSLIERIVAAGGWFVSVADGFDTRTPYGRLALNIMLSFAQFELERYRDGWRESRAKIIEQGRHYGPTPPLGYDRGLDGRLVPGRHAALVAECFERRGRGESVTVLARMLAEHGVFTGRGNAPTSRFVREMLANRVYLGEARAGDLVNPTAHEPLVDEVTWLRAGRANAPRPQRGEPSALTGLVRCEACRYVMGAAQSAYRDGIRRAYRCKGTHAAGRCPRPAFVLEDHLLPLVEEHFFEAVGQMTADAAGDERVSDLAVARDRVREQLVTYRDSAAILSPGDYADGLRVRQAAVDAAERELADAVASRPVGLPDAAALRHAWSSMPVDVRRRMLAAVIGAVVVARPREHRSHSEPLAGRVWFLAPSMLPTDLPRPGRRPTRLVAFGADDPSGARVPLG